ncbi:uncharacterized protein ASCRUDRAFT_8327 [Ascoidea rubescens DSM 1968]|uniref:valine--tRNA ligase n=1 Tax=Ascoidea rubescens DSM 1968 TaxID=1344418 RepID=A0A1D2VGD0_9ASCO|nr:hypothetical protein ASCRUDRAFT_8327 [Ascoidea rubescens DSM 1968]ODV60724.1 hypothetical protein ASCRUDRAFT_8327 [Ascoidea rubescens DSM 1968]
MGSDINVQSELKRKSNKKDKKAKKDKKDKKDKQIKNAPKAKQLNNVSFDYDDPTVPGMKKILPDFNHLSFKSYISKNVELSWFSWWLKNNFFSSSANNGNDNDNDNLSSILVNPLKTTSFLHLGNALNLIIQDFFYKSLEPDSKLPIVGFNHSGIDIQNVIEQKYYENEKLIKNNQNSSQFNDFFITWYNSNKSRIASQLFDLGISINNNLKENPIEFLNPKYINLVNNLFVKLYEKGLIYKKSDMINWSYYLNDSTSESHIKYINIKGRTLMDVPGYDTPIEFGIINYIVYPIFNSPTNEKLIIATTKPETIFADVAVLIHPDDDRYKHLQQNQFAINPLTDEKLPIILDTEMVDISFGTGAVRLAPSNNIKDYKISKLHNVKFVQIFNRDGTLNENCGQNWKGMKRLDARTKIIEFLKENNSLIKQEDNPMRIQICSRTNDVIEKRLHSFWYLKTKDLVSISKLIDEINNNNSLLITPLLYKRELVNKLSEIENNIDPSNNSDLCITSHYNSWGHQSPTYLVKLKADNNVDSNDENNWVVANSFDEAILKAKSRFPNQAFDIVQDEDIVESWFSLNLYSLISNFWHKSSNDINNLISEFKSFSRFITSNSDWSFIPSILISLNLTGKMPFDELIITPVVSDYNKRKLSKKLGNNFNYVNIIKGSSLSKLKEELKTITLSNTDVTKNEKSYEKSYPNGVSENGSDALRLYLLSYVNFNDFNEKDDKEIVFKSLIAVETENRFISKLYQAIKKSILNLGENFKYSFDSTDIEDKGLTLAEKWMLSKLNELVNYCRANLYNIKNMILKIKDFLNSEFEFFLNLTNYLLRDSSDYIIESVRKTTFVVLNDFLKVLFPLIPIVSEELFQRLINDNTDGVTIFKAKFIGKGEKYQKEAIKFSKIVDLVLESKKILSHFNINNNKTGVIYINSSNEETSDLLVQEKSIIESVLSKNVSKIFINESSSDIIDNHFIIKNFKDYEIKCLIKGVIEVEKEINKNEKKLAKVAKQKEAVEKLINGKDYETKVSEELKQRNRNKISGFELKISKINELISELKLHSEKI